MNLQWTSLDDIIVDLESTYGINSTNYINKLPLWIVNALANYQVYIPMEAAVVELPIQNDSIVVIPDDVKNISGLSYNNSFIRQGKSYRGFAPVPESVYLDMTHITGFQVEVTVNEEGDVISKHTTDFEMPIHDVALYKNYHYYVNNNRMITLDFGEVGETVKLYYIRLPHSRDRNHGGMLPMIPDNELVKQNITWFILQNLLYSGYSHPVLNLGSAMPYLNPAKMYENTFTAARSSFLSWNKADYGKIKNLFTTFIQCYNDSSANLIQH